MNVDPDWRIFPVRPMYLAEFETAVLTVFFSLLELLSITYCRVCLLSERMLHL